MDRQQKSRGFTLVELLVVIAIIGVLVSLLLPAVNAAREAARRTACKNNIRQLGLAVLNFESARRALPPGAFLPEEGADCKPGFRTNYDCFPINGTDPMMSWITLVLPFIEEQALFDQWKVDAHPSAQDPVVLAHVIGSLVCPSNAGAAGWKYTGQGSPGPRVDPGYAKGNYAAFVSSQHIDHQRWLPAALGGFKPGDKLGQKLGRIVDGVSKTLLAGEVRALALPKDHRGVWSLPYPGSTLLGLDWHHQFQEGESSKDIRTIERYIPDPAHASYAQLPNNYLNTQIGDSLFVCQRPDEMRYVHRAPCVRLSAAYMSAAPRSNHPGGVHVVALDGHAGFLGDDIDSYVFAYLIATNDRQPSDVTDFVR